MELLQTTLCYLEKDGAYLRLHRAKTKTDANHDKWGGVGGKKNGRWAFPPAGHDWTKKMRGGRFVPPACRYSGYQISPCSA